MTEPTVSHTKVVWTTLPPKPSETSPKHDLQARIETVYEKGIESLDLKSLLKEHLVLIHDAYDLAITAEKAGQKDVADAVRKHVVSVIPTSPASPLSSDARFITPALTGPYKAIGIKTFYLEDVSRNEKDLGHDVDRTRRVMIDVHYPAIQSKEPEYKIQPACELDAPYLKTPGGWTRSQPNLESIENKKFPIVLFSPGMGMSPDKYPQIVEELSSYGFCVITVNSPFISGYVAFLGKNQDIPTAPGIDNDSETMNKSKDLEFVIDQIKHDKIEGLEDCLDSDSIGVLGHSLGGSSAVQLCRNDKTDSVKAGINMDGWMYGNNASAPVKQPFLNIMTNSKAFHLDENQTDTEKEVSQSWKDFHQASPRSQNLILHNASHNDFSNDDLIFNWEAFDGPPSETSTQVINISTRYVVAFFQTHLKGQSSDLFNERTVCKVAETYDYTMQLAKAELRLLNLYSKAPPNREIVPFQGKK